MWKVVEPKRTTDCALYACKLIEDYGASFSYGEKAIRTFLQVRYNECLLQKKWTSALRINWCIVNVRFICKSLLLQTLSEVGIFNLNCCSPIRDMDVSAALDSKVIFKGAIAYSYVPILPIDTTRHVSDVIHKRRILDYYTTSVLIAHIRAWADIMMEVIISHNERQWASFCVVSFWEIAFNAAELAVL